MKTLFTKPIVIQLLPSLLLLGLLVTVATVSSLVLLTMSMILPIKLTIFGLVIVSTGYFIMRDALLVLPWSWQTIVVDTKGVLTLTNNRQQHIKPLLASTSFTHQYCIILNMKRKGLRLAMPPVLLLSNVASSDELKDELRRLRVWLRLFKSKSGKQTHQDLD